MIKKLRNQKGITLVFIVLIIFFISLISTAVVTMVALSIDLRKKENAEVEHKIVLENVMYEALTNLDITNLDIIEKVSIIHENYRIEINKGEVENQYLLTLHSTSKYQNIMLKVKIMYDSLNVTIESWGF